MQSSGAKGAGSGTGTVRRTSRMVLKPEAGVGAAIEAAPVLAEKV